MRKVLAVLAMCLVAASADAGSPLQGRWEIIAPSDPTFSGELMIDSEGRAISFGGSIRTAKSFRSRGYVSRLTDVAVEVTLTSGSETGRIKCAIQSSSVLNCDDLTASRSTSSQYIMRRTGPGPTSLLNER